MCTNAIQLLKIKSIFVKIKISLRKKKIKRYFRSIFIFLLSLFTLYLIFVYRLFCNAGHRPNGYEIAKKILTATVYDFGNFGIMLVLLKVTNFEKTCQIIFWLFLAELY